RWAERLRHRHPPAELARIARARHVRLARIEGAATGLGGSFAIVPDLAGLAWLQGRMVFYVAAALGYDPHHPMRPAELLSLQGLYSTPAAARAALDGLGRPLALHYVTSQRERDEQLTRRLVKLVGRRVAKRAALRVVPILASPVSAVQNARATGELGDRAIRYYGG
ncbi:MAG TPA: EcsC family protein, partial [Thermoleophilaceae bacterium]|nr:EcsC family protein [Thermoleophilaceae bacterium]